MQYDMHTFLYESVSRSFSLVTFWLHQNIGAKGALKMLMKWGAFYLFIADFFAT